MTTCHCRSLPGINTREVRAPTLVPGRLHRTADLTVLTPRDWLEVREAMGAQTVIDLRSDREIHRYGAPDGLSPAGIQWVRAPLTGYPSAPIDTARPGPDEYVRYYTTMLEDAEPGCLRTLFGRMAEVADQPFILSCHCGKDRTGVVITAILAVLGTDTATMMAEYAASADALAANVDHYRDKWVKRGHTRADYIHRLRVKPETVAHWLAEVETRHQSLRALLEAQGVRPADLDVLRQRLARDGGSE